MASAIGCGITGFKQVKIPNKMKVHKYSGIIMGLTSLWHIAAVKRWDKIFKQDSTTINANKRNS